MLLLLAVAVVAGALTRALGVGYSLLLAPAAAAVLPPEEAVCLVLAVGAGLNAALVLRSGRPALPPTVLALIGGGLAGQAAAAAVVGTLDSGALRIVAGCALLAGCVATALQAPRRPEGARDAVALGVPAGAAIGAVGFLTGITGPFAAVWLARRSGGGTPLRRCVFVTVAALSASGLALQAAAGAGTAPAGQAILLAVALAPALAAGALLAGPATARLAGQRHRLALATVAALGAVLLLVS
jgi:uncharacterized membrane protein YfcA